MRLTSPFFASPRRLLPWLLGVAAVVATGGNTSAASAVIVEIPTPSAQSLPQGLDVAADGSVFYTETGAGKIARVLDRHVTREYTLPAGASPNIVKVASD